MFWKLGLTLLIAASFLKSAVILGPGPGGVLPDALPDGTPQTFTSDVLVNNSLLLVGVGNAITLDLYGLTHTYAGDLGVTLTHLDPTGTITLGSGSVFYRIGKTNPLDAGDLGYPADFGDSYHFNSGFSGSLWNTAALLGDTDIIPGDAAGSGAYYTTDPFSAAPNSFSSLFAGQSLNGIWRLQITDYSFGDTGSLQSWAVTVEDSTTVPEPASIFLTAAALCAISASRRCAGRLGRKRLRRTQPH